jgi:hypothetical protein
VYGLVQTLVHDLLPGARDRGCIVNAFSVHAPVAVVACSRYADVQFARVRVMWSSQLTRRVTLNYAAVGMCDSPRVQFLIDYDDAEFVEG